MDDFARKKGPRVFIAYSGQRAFEYVEELAMHLRCAFDPFYDTQLRAYPWGQQLLEEFDRSEAAIALVDNNFLNSVYVTDVEVPQLIARNIKQEIPIVAIAVAMSATAVERKTYDVPIANGHIEKHTLAELVWIPQKVQDDNERHHRTKPLSALEQWIRDYRYEETLHVLLSDIDRRAREAPKPAPSQQTPAGSAKTWRMRFAAISTTLLAWTRTIEHEWIPRPELDELEARLTDGSCTSSTHLLLGSPGSGKSAFLAELGHRLQRRDWTIFALKADELSAETESSAALTHELQLPAEATMLIKALASETQPCVVLIDQLDSVASMVERHTGRLDVLIELIVALHKHSHVHIVASCRNFEHDNDPRIRGLAASRIVLQLPESETVSEFIRAHSQLRFEPGADILALLRTPHNLRLLLEHPNIDIDALNDPLDLVGMIAEREFEPGQRELAAKLASTMGEREELFVRRYAQHNEIYAPLIGAKARFVELRDDELRFTHQLVFEYFWARGAIELGLAVVFAGGSQTTLVRPRLRIVLRYLRSRGIDTFYTQLDVLWAEPKLHRHLRSLIITFIARRSDPTAADVRWVVKRIQDPAFRGEILRQIAEPAWFELLHKTIDGVMQSGEDDALSVSRILAAAAATSPNRVLDLLRKHWLVEARIRPLQFKLRDFDEKVSLELIEAWIETTAFDACDWYMIYGFFSDRPGNERHAAAVAGSYAAKRIADLAREVSLLDGGYGRRSPLERGLEAIELPPGAKLFAGASGLFLRRIWHAVSALVGLVEPRGETRWYAYRITPIDIDGNPTSLAHIIFDACVDFAKNEHVGFAAFARSYGTVDSGTLQGALCVGIRELSSHEPQLALELLIEEPRRLMVGSSFDPQFPRLSREIISIASKATAPEQLERLAHTILALKPSAGVEADRFAETREREDDAIVAGLLDAIPPELRPRDALVWLDAHSDLPAHLRWWTREPSTRKMSIIISPISQRQFANMGTVESAELFVELNDDTEWHHPTNWEVGGSIQASRELAKALLQTPERADELFEHFQPGKQERPIAYTVREWASAGQRELVLKWVRWAENRGHSSFRADFAWALAKVAEHGGGLDDEFCAMLERWLNEWPEEDQNSRKQSEEWNPSKAVLEEPGAIIPQGSFSVLEALLLGLLRRETPDLERALAKVDKHWRLLATPARFSAFGRYVMVLLMHFEPSRTASLVLDRLNMDISPLLSAPSVTPLMRLTADDTRATELYRQIALQIRESDWSRGSQAYAELSTWAALWQRSEWAVASVEAIIQSERVDEKLVAGVLHVATKHVIEFSEAHESFATALDWLVRLLPYVVSSDLGPVWLKPLQRARHSEDIGHAARTLLPLFKAAALRPEVMAKARTDLFIVANQLVHEAPSYVALFTKGFLQHYVKQGQVPHLFDEETDALVGIIAMLQRKPHQLHHVYDILDALITLNPYGLESIFSALEASD